MKKFIYLLIFITAALLIWGTYTYWSGKASSISLRKNVLNKNQLGNYFEVDHKDKTYAVSWVKASSDDISLFANFDEKLTSSEAIEENKCTSLISGGFYSEENEPIGLFISNYQTLSNPQVSSLFNGFFYIDEETASITTLAPDEVRLAVQTGPALILNEDVLNIRASNDSYARRIVSAVNKDGEIFFFVIYQKESLILGPLLNDLPSIVEKINSLNSFDIISAINLDGGAHSAFITKDAKLTEISRIGSYFCISK